MTIGAMAALQELNLSIPRDLAYVGFDDFDWAGLLRPRLTTVAQPVFEIGQTAAELVLERIGEEQSRPARRIALGASLIVRDSSGPTVTDRRGAGRTRSTGADASAATAGKAARDRLHDIAARASTSNASKATT